MNYLHQVKVKINQQLEEFVQLTLIQLKFRFAYKVLIYFQDGWMKKIQILVGRKEDIVSLFIERRKRIF